MLPKEAIKEFIKIHRKLTGVKLSEKEASVVAQRLFDGLCEVFKYKDTLERGLN